MSRSDAIFGAIFSLVAGVRPHDISQDATHRSQNRLTESWSYQFETENVVGTTRSFGSIQAILLDPLCGLLSVICQNDIGSSAFEARQGFHDNVFFVEPPPFAGRLDHGVFARHMVGGNGQVGIVLEATNDVQIGHARFDHEHVRAFGRIEGRFDERFATIGGILLVGLLVAKARVAIQRVTEGTVVRRGILCRVG
jgi:hypothetical protein